ncbi:MAG TPA: hypothetical protein ACFYEF_01210 [Candidatus Wunengus sp. YC63]|uniref:hypothetical protein n=1 Tax=Candidatus Wunengus sp. YC63 TaxID=3367699 RepID=UPI00402700AD
MISAKRGRVMFLFTAVIMGISFIQTALYSQDVEMADIYSMASTKIKDINENPSNYRGIKLLIIGNVVRKIEERQEAGVSKFEFEDEWGGNITVKTLDGKLPEDFKDKKFMILGTVELDSETDDPSDVYFHEKSRKSIPSVIEPQPKEHPPEQPPVNLQPHPEPPAPQEPPKPKNRIPPLMIILGSVGVACAVIGLGFFIWSLSRRSQRQENLSQALGTSMGTPPPFPPVNVPTEVVKDTSVPTAVVIEHGYLGILSGDGKESARMDLYKHGEINENGEYVYTISRAIHGDEHRTIKLSEDDNLTTRGVHAKLFVNKTTGEFKLAQFYNSNPVAIRRSKGGDVIKLKQGDQPVVLEDKDVLTIGRTSLILHKA